MSYLRPVAAETVEADLLELGPVDAIYDEHEMPERFREFMGLAALPDRIRQFVGWLRWPDRAGADDDARTQRFYQLWSTKEAVLKALGSGLLVAPQRFEVDTTALAAPQDAGCGPASTTQIELGEADQRTPGTLVDIHWCSLALPAELSACAAVAWLAPDDQWHCW